MTAADSVSLVVFFAAFSVKILHFELAFRVDFTHRTDPNAIAELDQQSYCVQVFLSFVLRLELLCAPNLAFRVTFRHWNVASH